MNEIRKTNRFFMILMLAFIIVSLAWGILPLSGLPIKMEWIEKFSMLLPELLMLVIMLLYMGKNKLNFLNCTRFRLLSPLIIFLLFIMGIVILPMVSFINAISMMFTTNLVQNEMLELGRMGFLFSLFAMAVVPAFVEESVYRGVIGTVYMSKSWKKGVLLSAFLFGIMHMNFNQFSYAFVIGLLFAVVVEATDSILSGMILHFMINGNSVVMAFLVSKIESLFDMGQAGMETTEYTQMTWAVVGAYFIPAIISFLFFCLLVFLITKINGRDQILKEKLQGSRTETKDETRLWSWHLTVATILCLVVAVLTEIGSRI